MCGIAGYYAPHALADEALVHAMCEDIRHRGPDDEGLYIDGGCGLGMRRLSIIDLSTGHQPIANEDHSVWVVFNGEIYQYAELRRQLEQQGHRFVTRTDTEVLVHLYEQEGVAGFSKLRGMFAFAIWDARRRKLILARDRFGKKPLYYAALPHGLFFASELKSLRTAGVPLELDAEAIRLYFGFSCIPDPWSPWKAIRKLAPGSWLEYSEDGSIHTGAYWNLPWPEESGAGDPDDKETLDRLREKFDECVRIRMVADVPLGAFLSGGIDSSSVVASMARQSDSPINTFSIGFEEPAYNELPWARQVAEFYKTRHHELIVRPDSIELLSRLVRSFDEPFGDASAIPTYLVSEFAARHVKVALTGDGGDELFCGYESFFAVQNARRWDALPAFARRFLACIGDLAPYSMYGKNYLRMISRPNPLERYFELNYTPYYLRKALLRREWMLSFDREWLCSTLGHFVPRGDAHPLAAAVYFEATAKLTGDMLVKVDRMSMANSLEVRSPMLDYELADLAMRIPFSSKMRNGRGKDVLIRAIGDRLPPALLRRPKKGFGVPLAVWFRGSLKSFLADHLTSRQFLDRGIVEPRFVRHLLDEHFSGRRENEHWLYTLLMLELWFREAESESANSRRGMPRAELPQWAPASSR